MAKLIEKRDMMILSELRKDGRRSLTQIARKTNIPVSTLFDKLKHYKGTLVSKFTTLLNFSMLGFNTRATIVMKVDKRFRGELKLFLQKHSRVNSLYRINNGFDFMIEGLFYDVKELEYFMSELEGYNVLVSKVYYIIDDIKREAFLENTFGGRR